MGDGLSVSELLANASQITALSDFGEDWFLTPLTRLVDDVNANAGLMAPDAGAGQRIQGALLDRLVLVQYFKDHPDAADEKITPACAIVGLPRTGSTVLHRLLASAPDLTSLRWWETCFPFPFPNEKPGDPVPRISMAHQIVEQLLNDWPDFESIDPIEAEAVAEEVILLDRTFLSTTYDSMMPIPEYGFWQAEQDHEPAYRDMVRFMQAIQHQRGGSHGKKWVLKTPHHLLGGMNGLLSVFPDITLVMTHRNLQDVLPSYCSMCASLSVGASTTYDPKKQGAYWSRRFLEGLERFEQLREALPEDRIIDVRYQETVADPVGTAERVLKAIDMDFDTAAHQAMEKSIAENARDKRPKHKYSAEQFGLTSEGIKNEFSSYHDKYLGNQGSGL